MIISYKGGESVVALMSILSPLSLPPRSAEMGKMAVRYAVVDAFTSTAFRGNPAAVCWLEEPRGDEWMQSVAAEFNISQTAFLSRAAGSTKFQLRWFTPTVEVELCGHATLAASHFLLTSGLEASNVIEFNTKSGVLTAKRVDGENQLGNSKISNGRKNKFSIELDFPMVSVVDCDETEIPLIPESLKGASVVDVKKTTAGDLIVELKSGKEVADVQPQIIEIQKCAGRGVIITGLAPASSGFDFFSRFFCPKCGINEDPVCGSVHCALAPYWSKKMGKNNFIAYMASSRGGRLDVQLEEENRRVRIRGEAITIMEGTLRV